MTIGLGDHFTFRKLIRFYLPAVGMMVFTSVYSIVDGFFVSNFTGKTSFAAVNFIWPFVMMLGTVGFMFGAGGNALISKTMGEGDAAKANRTFSLLIYIGIVSGVALMVLGGVCIKPVAVLMGAEGDMLSESLRYGRVLLVGLPFYILQFEFQSFFATAGKPRLGFCVTVFAGVTNMVLDAIFVGLLRWGVIGAAAASVASQAVGGCVPILYFALPNHSLLRLGRTRMDAPALGRTCFNGASELLSNISMAFVSMLYNIQLMRNAGENGVAAYGVLMYVGFVFFAIFIGFDIGASPLIAYHYGAANGAEIRNILVRSMVIIAITALTMFLTAELLCGVFARLFVSYDEELMAMTSRGFRIYSFAFLLGGFAMFVTAFFTALNNGLISGLLSFLRTCAFPLAVVYILPLWWGIDGVWAALVVAEILSVLVALVFLLTKRRRYGY